MRYRVVPTLVALLVAVAAAGPARAQSSPLGVSVTDSLLGEWHGANQNGEPDDDDYGAVLNRLDLTATSGALTAQAQVDSFYFVEPPTDDFEQNTVLERLTASFRAGDWHVVGGDFRLQFGRGIIVAIRKEADIGLDLALRGGQVEVTAGDHRVSVLAGLTNPANLDGVTQHAVEDADDTMAGASWRFTGIDGVNVDVFGLYLEPRERLLDDRDYSVSGGASVELGSVLDWLVVYLEGDAQERRLAGTSKEGYAGYLEANVYVGDTTFLVEGLLLDQLEQLGSRNSALGTRFQYNRPPTLERIEEEIPDNRDVMGARLRVEHYLAGLDLTLFANGTIRLNQPGDPAELRQLHGYGGLELRFQGGSSRFSLSGGYRDERQERLEVRTMIHGELDYLQSLTSRLALHLSSVTERRTLVGEPYMRGYAIAGLDLATVGSLSFELGFDTQDPSPDVANLFYAGHLFWRAADWLDVGATGGTERGGIKCISGVCRDFPAFAGARLELVGRF